jgi:hypothetical protein
LQGKIDDARIYDQALTANEIQRIYNATRPSPINTSRTDRLTAGLVGFWSMNGQDVDLSDSTAEVKDTTANNNHGDAKNGAQPAIGKLGQGFGFDGEDDYVETANPTSITDGNFTVSLWAKQDGSGAPAAFSQNIPSSWSDDLFIFYIGDSSNNEEVRIWWDGGNALHFSGNGGGGVSDWRHYTLTRSGSNFTLYKNGNQVPTASKGGAWTSTSQGLGAANNSSSWVQNFEGRLDNVRIYDRVLSADEVEKLYRLGQ